MAEGPLRTAGTPGAFADAEPQTTRSEALRIVVLDHPPCCLGLDDRAARPQELAQKPGDVRRRSVRASPGSAQLPPVGTVPVPLPGLRIAAPRFRRRAFHLAGNHLFQFELSESLSRVRHTQGLKDTALDKRENV